MMMMRRRRRKKKMMMMMMMVVVEVVVTTTTMMMILISALGRCKGYAIYIGVNSRYQAPYVYEKQKQNIGNR
ncbi:hypothetical protein DPMN_143593 [Dreissena polymorpha]|uniref:Uncharacterized protein n=1 Tax=Dreissena polymorpha TaxID=45954 RepID=A0A9D4JLT8_DREPO|nr:hypothetical protein DPMN_143593 [Dreissena polymorpha]